MTSAPAGTATEPPTASMTPPRMTTVPESIAAPAAVTIRAPRTANTFGVSARSASVAAAMVLAKSRRRFIKLLPFRVALVEREMFVVERHLPSRNHHAGDRGPDLERIAFRDEEIADLAGLDAAETVADAENLRGVDRQRFERLLARQAPGDRHRRVV